ncbi:MAG TPA: DUF881 domain-containing protein [Actinomycetaceae bacterium]|nr:DUF881 domain-containing protein [Actinomycetaceae bacterium]
MARSDAPGPQPPPPAANRGARRSIGVLAVALLAGLLFATNASLFRGQEARQPTNLLELARAESERLEANESEITQLRAQVADLLAEQAGGAPAAEVDELVSFHSGSTAVSGPGLVVEMWDAPPPADIAGSGLTPDDLVVHQQDLEAVINALWVGGAEALMIQDQRISADSSVRCVGNVLLLHGRHYSPPYRIAAIGDPDHLADAVLASPGVQVYLQYVEAINLGWGMEKHDQLDMPPYLGATRMEYARVPASYAAQQADSN